MASASHNSSLSHPLRVVSKLDQEDLVTDQSMQVWRLTELLMRTQHSELFLARPAQHQSDQPADYVVKSARTSYLQDPVSREAFLVEIGVGRSVSHPNLVPVLGVNSEAPQPFLVMPRIAGHGLGNVISRAGRLQVTQALWIARQVAQGLAELHHQGWLHGDVKPANIIVDRRGHATLVDLGSVLSLQQACPARERPLVGTLNYLAPELLVSHGRVSPRCDIYALGATLYELLAGQPPFRGENAAQVARAHLQQRPPQLSSLLPTIPTEVSQLVARMLAKEPLRRPESMNDVVAQLIDLEIETLPLRVQQLMPSA